MSKLEIDDKKDMVSFIQYHKDIYKGSHEMSLASSKTHSVEPINLSLFPELWVHYIRKEIDGNAELRKHGYHIPSGLVKANVIADIVWIQLQCDQNQSSVQSAKVQITDYLRTKFSHLYEINPDGELKFKIF
jgi:hypothetical protein